MFLTLTLKLSAQEITMFPGIFSTKYYQDENRITKKEIHTLMQQHELTKMYWSKSKLHNNVSKGSFVASFLFLFWYAASNDGLINGKGFSLNSKMIGFLGASTASIGFSFSAKSLRKKAIVSYNRINTDDKTSLFIGQTYNGLGIVFNF